MGILTVWLCICVTLAYSNASVCPWMQTQSKAFQSNFQFVSNISITVLQQAFKDAACPRDKITNSVCGDFPNKVYDDVMALRTEDQILFILESLTEVKELYRRKYETAECDQKKLVIFLLDTDRQISELRQCVSKSSASVNYKGPARKMKRHFHSLKGHLKNKDYGANAWNDVTAVVLKHMQRLKDLAAATTRHEPRN